MVGKERGVARQDESVTGDVCGWGLQDAINEQLLSAERIELGADSGPELQNLAMIPMFPWSKQPMANYS
jgi:hypothetical protein